MQFVALVVLRLYVALSTIVSGMIVWFDSSSVTARALLKSGDESTVHLFGLLALIIGSTAIWDTVVNDIMDWRFEAPLVKRWRHLIFMVLAFFGSVTAFIILKELGQSMVLLRYILDSVMAASVACMGVRETFLHAQRDKVA